MTTVRQDVLPLLPNGLPVFRYTRQEAGRAAVKLASSTCQVLGLALSQNNKGVLDRIAVATEDEVHIIHASGTRSRKLDKFFFKLLASEVTTLAGFGMAKLALRLQGHLDHRVRGVDLSTLFLNTSEAAVPPSEVIQKSGLCPLTNGFRVDRLWHENDQKNATNELCLRAWISAKVANCAKSLPLVRGAQKVDTNLVKAEVLACLHTLIKQNDLLALTRPRISNNEFDSFKMKKGGKIELVNSRYKTRVRHSNSSQSYVEITAQDGSVYQGFTTGAKGKTTAIKLHTFVPNATPFQSVSVVGLEDPTAAEKAQEALVLRILQGQVSLLDAPFVRYLWFRSHWDVQRLNASSEACAEMQYIEHLNPSQAEVVGAMTCTAGSPIVVVHGPPGTGKTTTISSAAEIWSKVYLEPVWIIGHSNVSVKNIAEKLSQRNVDFKLIVSKEFYVEWHEHIYEKIQENLIRTDRLPRDRVGLSRMIGSSTVILSTLALLSNPGLERNGMFDIVPVQNLVVDEASQIDVFEYMHVFYEFRNSLGKVCFFGDPKQLPPFGQEECRSLQSVFDVPHLKGNSYFLDVQYRMPVPLGSFISTHVYGSQLKSCHAINDFSCVRFVDAWRGKEEKKGLSWTNSVEVSIMVNLVRNYYRSRKFCIITPYDAQRAAIQRALKQEELPWEHVFNVDSFQGNEADYVLISVVRSTRVGFLQFLNRMNVMLTRCRKGMVIVFSRSFLRGAASRTLLGQLCAYLTVKEGPKTWVDAGDVLNMRVDLPGVAGRSLDDVIGDMSKLDLAH